MFYGRCNILFTITVALKFLTNLFQFDLKIVEFRKDHSTIYQSIYHGILMVKTVKIFISECGVFNDWYFISISRIK